MNNQNNQLNINLCYTCVSQGLVNTAITKHFTSTKYAANNRGYLFISVKSIYIDIYIYIYIWSLMSFALHDNRINSTANICTNIQK